MTNLRKDLAEQLRREHKENKPCASIPELRQWFVTRMVNQAGMSVSVEWVMPLHRVTFPTGLRGIIGQAKVSAEGFATRNFMVSADAFGKSAH